MTRKNDPQPGENEAKVVTDGAEDDVGGIGGATFEIAAAEMGLCFHMYDHRLDGGVPRESSWARGPLARRDCREACARCRR